LRRFREVPLIGLLPIALPSPREIALDQTAHGQQAPHIRIVSDRLDAVQNNTGRLPSPQTGEAPSAVQEALSLLLQLA
jgi:hypothetical protein